MFASIHPFNATLILQRVAGILNLIPGTLSSPMVSLEMHISLLLHVFGLGEETEAQGGHTNSMHSGWRWKPHPPTSGCEASVLITKPPCLYHHMKDKLGKYYSELCHISLIPNLQSVHTTYSLRLIHYTVSVHVYH